MTAFNPIPPAQAAEQLRLADIEHAEQLLADFAAAGLVRTYSRVTETIHAGGQRVVIRDAAIPAEIWRRIIADGKCPEAWATGTVRLDGSPHLGTAAVTLVGIRINPEDVQGTARQHGKWTSPLATQQMAQPIARSRRKGSPAPTVPQLPLLDPLPSRTDDALEASSSVACEVPPNTVAVDAPSKPKRVDMPDPDALWVTVNQAMALTNLGRTKVNELMNDTSFKKKKVGRRTLIERVSIDAYMAAN